MNITSGKINCAEKVVIYGPEGVGKSTIASKFPNPLFIDTEGSTKRMDVRRMEKPTSWTMLKEQINYVINTPSVCKSLIIDTIDWAEQLCINKVCADAGKKGIEDFGYGNGYVYEKEEFARFLMLLDKVIDAGINVVLTAHAQLRKFEQPDEMGAYDRWELKLGKKTSSQISPLVKEWADMVLFANYKTFAVQSDKEGKKFKAQGNKRVMYAAHHPCWDAKNRHGLADELPFEYSAIAHIFDKSVKPVERVRTIEHETFTEITEDPLPMIMDPEEGKPTVNPNISRIPQNLLDLMNMSQVTDEEIRKTVAARGFFPADTPIENYEPDFIDGWIIAHWSQVVDYIKNNLR